MERAFVKAERVDGQVLYTPMRLSAQHGLLGNVLRFDTFEEAEHACEAINEGPSESEEIAVWAGFPGSFEEEHIDE
jgi:hypothetical protein